VACGLGLSLIVVDRTNMADRLEQVWCACYFTFPSFCCCCLLLLLLL